MERCNFRGLEYLVKEPAEKQAKYPAIFFLHGAGTRGRDLAALENNAFFSEASCVSRDSFPFLVFAPQCPAYTWFDVFERLTDLAKMATADPRVDPGRFALMGTSMGGYAAWQLAIGVPELFSALVPICGGGMACFAQRLVHIPVWAFHGREDPVVSVEESIRMVESVRKEGGTAKLTVLDGTGHNCWDHAYGSTELFDWVLEQKAGSPKTEQDSFSGSRFG